MVKFSASHSSSRFCTTSRSSASAPLTLNDVAIACSLASPASASRSSATASLSAVSELLERTTSSVQPSSVLPVDVLVEADQPRQLRRVGVGAHPAQRGVALEPQAHASKVSPSMVTVASIHSFSPVSW